MSTTRDQELLQSRAAELLREHQQEIYCGTDRLFAGLMWIQWAAAIATALWLTPFTWSATARSVHFHVWLAIGLGGILCLVPALLVSRWPGSMATRHVIAVSQVLFSSLLIHLTGGRIETHFHVFGSLAFLAAYRDWRVLATATAVVVADHFLRGVVWPESVFGIVPGSRWRWVEHAAWVLFECLFLMINIRQSEKEMRRVADQTARLEDQSELAIYSERLARSVERERAVIQGALDAIVLINRRGEITSWNPQAERIFGWTAEEAIGKSAEIVVPPQFRAAHSAGVQRYAKTGRGPVHNRRLELEALHRNGQLLPIEIAITPIHDGEDLAFCAFVRDIAARRNAERELREAIDQAHQANRSKSAFLANMSHEIRTPLNASLGFTEILRRQQGLTPQQSEYLETIHSSGQHLLTLINDILDLSKVESGHLEIERVQCSPHEIISEVLSITRIRAQEKGISLECRWTSGAPETILTDPERLRQLLMNLIGNAIKFTEKGGVMLVASIENRETKPRLALEIHDTGIGIRPDQLGRIFTPFSQADSSITRRFGGTGLGLAISRRIAQHLGGDITVESVFGRGSIFRVTLEAGSLSRVQFIENPPSEMIIARQRPVQTDHGPTKLEGVRVLVVDDGETNRQLISIVLKDAGAQVVCAENGLEGLEAASRENFDVILMDMQMPLMDGYAAASQLRARGFERPIIALTAHAMRGDEARCRSAGCSGYMSKPINIDRLLAMIAGALSENSAQSSPGTPAAVPDGLTMREPGVPAIPAATFSSGNPAAAVLELPLQTAIRSTLPTNRPEFQRIVEAFVDKLQIRLGEMRQAVDSEDWPALAELAHWLKGSGGTVGFACLTEAAIELEKAAREAPGADPRSSLKKLTALAERITAAPSD